MSKDNAAITILIPAIIAALMLFVAVANLPYDYYILLRWVVAICAIIILYAALILGLQHKIYKI